MFHLAPTLRALTSGSPITTALREARRMAQRHLQTGGPAIPRQRQADSSGYVLPTDVDVAALATAIEAKLRGGGDARFERSGGVLNLLQRKPDGRVVVPRVVLERLGGGVAEGGEQTLGQLVGEMRRQRVLAASRARQR